jgi:hypothetical protein
MPRSAVQSTFYDGLGTTIANSGTELGPATVQRPAGNSGRCYASADGVTRFRRIRRPIAAIVSTAILSGSVLFATAPTAQALPRCTDLYAYAMAAQWAWSDDVAQGYYEAAAGQAEVLEGYLTLIRNYC